jgi:hypothetical protein
MRSNALFALGNRRIHWGMHPTQPPNLHTNPLANETLCATSRTHVRLPLMASLVEGWNG